MYLPSLPEGSFIDIVLRYRHIADPVNALADAIFRGPSPLSPAEREMLGAYVSYLNRSPFCAGIHDAVAGQIGGGAGLARRLAADPELSEAPPNLRPLLRYVRKLTLDPANVGRADALAVFAAGWNEDALVHAALVCAYFSLMNRWVLGLGVSPDPSEIAGAARMMAAHGYRSVAEMGEILRGSA